MHINDRIFQIKKGNPSHGNFQNQLSNPSLSHIKQECQDSFIKGKIQIQTNSYKDLEYW